MIRLLVREGARRVTTYELETAAIGDREGIAVTRIYRTEAWLWEGDALTAYYHHGERYVR